MPNAKKTSAQSDLLAKWKQRKKPAAQAISSRPEDALVRPTSGQRRLWLLQELYPNNAFYQYGHLYHFTGPLRADLLEESFRRLVARHEILRTNYVSVNEALEMVVRPAGVFQLGRIDLSGHDEQALENIAHTEAHNVAKQRFNLAEDLLIRATLIQLGQEHHQLVLSLHHIIGDRGSLLVLNAELYRIYSALVAATEPELPALPAQFPDFAHWKNQRPVPEKSLTYWRKNLSGELPVSALPFNRPRRAEATFAGESMIVSLTPEDSDRVRELARSLGTTANVVLLAAYQALLLRYSAQKDLTVGTPVSIRDRTELENMIGFLNETVVLRSQFDDPTETFRAFVGRVKEQVEGALVHKDVSFDELVNYLQPVRISGSNPLFQNMFVYNVQAPVAELPANLTVTDKMMDLGVSKFDLTLFATDLGLTFEFTLEFATDLFDEDTASRLLTNQLALLVDAVTRPETPISELNLLSEEELELRTGWNETAVDLPHPTSVVDFILTAASHTPQATAVADQNDQLSYASLLNRADQLTAKLITSGTKPGDIIGLSCGRSVDLAVGILGVLRAGAAYVPLDPAYPAGRVAYVVKDAGIKLIVTQTALHGRFSDYKRIDIPTGDSPTTGLEFPILDPASPAYLIYTSGSTGRPKGVVISHANLVHSTTARFAFFDNDPRAFLLLSSFAFDSSVAGIFWTLSKGGALVIPPERIEQDMELLAGQIKQHEITHTLLLPSLYQLLLEQIPVKTLASLQTVMVAGEACSGHTVSTHFRRLPQVELVNEYGPTEGTVWCTAHKIRPEDGRAAVPIGRPIPNVRNYILDDALQQVPIGVPGELFIAGAGLAQGYWRQDKMTQERFPQVALGAGAGAVAVKKQRLYRTGDLASYRPNGLIDFLGRADRQAKIRGYRVEPGEISRVLDAHSAVREAVTIIDQSGPAPRLVAYFTTYNTVDIAELRTTLSEALPAYMVPAIFMPLAEFPRLPNGKVNVPALPTPAASEAAISREFAAPETETEEVLARIWAGVLKLPRVGRFDNYFDIGGDSIRSIRVIAQARKAGLVLAPTHLFRFQTLHELAKAVDAQQAGETTEAERGNSIVSLNQAQGGDPLFCIHSGGGHVFFYQPLAASLPEDRPVYAIQPSTLATGEALPESIETMAADYLREIRKVRAHGPYHLLGTCFSNAVVLEIAHQLKAAGDEVGRLIFVDSGPTRLEQQPEVKTPTVSNAVNILKNRNWPKLRRALYRRWFYIRQALGATVETEEQKQVRLTTNGLYQLYFRYDWEPISAPVTLIRSTEFDARADKAFHIEQWNKLAAEGLDVRVTPGTHLNLFASPQAEGLAQHVEECLRVATEA